MPRDTKPARLEFSRTRNIYEIRYHDGSRSRRLSTGTASREEAETVLRGFLDAQTNPAEPVTAPANGHIKPGLTLREAWQYYLDTHVPTLAAPERACDAMRPVLSLLGDRTVVSLRRKDFEDYINLRGSGQLSHTRRTVQDGTMRRELSGVRAVLNYNVAHEKLLITNVPQIPLPAKPEPRLRFLDREEVAFLLARLPETRYANPDRLSRVERFIWLALCTGARSSAIRTRRWCHVDFDRRLIDFGDEGRETKKRRAVTYISDDLLPILERAQSECQGRSPRDWLLDESGAIKKSFGNLMQKLGWTDVTPHTLRHTWATHALANGASMEEVARHLRITMATADRIYAKSDVGLLRKAAQRVSWNSLEAERHD